MNKHKPTPDKGTTLVTCECGCNKFYIVTGGYGGVFWADTTCADCGKKEELFYEESD